MRLSLRCDFGFRFLTMLAVEPERSVSISDGAARLEVSAHHIAKVVQDLAWAGWVETTRGRGGGVRLAPGAMDVTLGDVARALEPMDLVECFDPETNGCVLAPGCELKGVLQRAQLAFMEVLDQHTVRDLIKRRDQLVQIVASNAG